MKQNHCLLLCRQYGSGLRAPQSEAGPSTVQGKRAGFGRKKVSRSDRMTR